MTDPVASITVIVAIFFLILYTGLVAFQYVSTRVHEEQGDQELGPYMFAMNYGFSMISNSIAPLIFAPYKWQMSFAALGFALNYALSIFTIGTAKWMKYTFSGIGAVVNGFANSVLWVSFGRYIHCVCHQNNKTSQKGYYIGLFKTIFSFSGVVGAVVVTFGLDLLSHQNYFILVGGIAVFAFVFSMVLMKDVKPMEDEQAVEKKTLKQMLVSTFSYYPRMRHMLMFVLVDGVNVGIMTTTLSHLVPVNQPGDQLKFGYCLLSLGVGTMIGGYYGGKLCDVIKVRRVGQFCVIAYVFSCLAGILAAEVGWYALAVLVFMIQGMQASGVEACLLVMCSKVYGGASETFAVNKQFQGLSFVLFEVIMIVTSNSIPLQYVMTGALLLAIPTWFTLGKMPDGPESQHLSTHLINQQNSQQ